MFWFWMCKAPISIGAAGSSAPLSAWGFAGEAEPWHFCMFRLALFEMRLLYAGQPLHPSAPPVPLHLPPPGHDPVGVWSAATYVAPGVFGNWGALAFGDSLKDGRGVLATTLGGRLRAVGRSDPLALRYSPQALQIVAPSSDLLQRGVRVVPQLLTLS